MSVFLTNDEIVSKLTEKLPVPCWTWNGYSEQQVAMTWTKEGVNAAVLAAKKAEGFESATVIEENDDILTVVVINRQEFHGERYSLRIYTNREGEVVMDQDTDGYYDFIPA